MAYEPRCGAVGFQVPVRFHGPDGSAPDRLIAVDDPRVPEPGTIALDLTCAECGRSPRAGETWRILFADKVAREAVIYCPECAEREFGEPE